MEHLNTGIESMEVNDIKGRDSVRRVGLGGEGSVGSRSGCIIQVQYGIS